MWNYNYFTYILTNATKTVLYIGVTNDLSRRLYEHKNCKGNQYSFTSKYFCYYLVYYEHHTNVEHAISREKELKGWRRDKKLELISSVNPAMRFLNDEVTG
jgi:putative endonuclease